MPFLIAVLALPGLMDSAGATIAAAATLKLQKKWRLLKLKCLKLFQQLLLNQ